jgi:hypothetical protein
MNSRFSLRAQKCVYRIRFGFSSNPMRRSPYDGDMIGYRHGDMIGYRLGPRDAHEWLASPRRNCFASIDQQKGCVLCR